MSKIVFIGHAISGDPVGNRQKVLDICRELQSPDIMPTAPYAFLLDYLEEKDWPVGQLAVDEYFRRRFVDELWLYGTRISDGMRKEIKLAYDCGIPVLAKTPETKAALPQVLRELAL